MRFEKRIIRLVPNKQWRLRVKDIDFEQNQVIVREGKELRKRDCFAVARNDVLCQLI
mgnify:CR=1 FL=1